MIRLPKLFVALSVFALIALSSPGVQLARADAAGEPSAVSGELSATQDPRSCLAAPSTARDGVGASALADVRARLEATAPEEDVIPLNGAGYNYRSDARTSNELLFLDAELQH